MAYKEVHIKGKEGAQALYKALGDANSKIAAGSKKKSATKKTAPKKAGK